MASIAVQIFQLIFFLQIFLKRYITGCHMLHWQSSTQQYDTALATVTVASVCLQWPLLSISITCMYTESTTTGVQEQHCQVKLISIFTSCSFPAFACIILSVFGQ